MTAPSRPRQCQASVAMAACWAAACCFIYRNEKNAADELEQSILTPHSPLRARAVPRPAHLVAVRAMGAAASSDAEFTAQVQQKNSQNPVVVYSKTYCPCAWAGGRGAGGLQRRGRRFAQEAQQLQGDDSTSAHLRRPLT